MNQTGGSGNEIAGILNDQYPFTIHKNIHWDDFSTGFSKHLSDESLSDQNYLIMRELIYRIPDARLNLSFRKDNKLRKAETSGYIGFDLAYSPDGYYFVCSIDSQGEAWSKGIREGYQVAGWNRLPVSRAIEEFPLRWGFNPATGEMRQLLACHYLCRGEPGSSAEIFYVNEQENTKGVRINFTPRETPPVPAYIGIPEKTGDKPFEFRLLNDSLGYLRLDKFTPRELRLFRRNVVPYFEKLSGLIIDLRENSGGYDHIAVDIAGYFVSESRFYEESFIRNGEDILTIGHLESTPADPGFRSGVIVITGPLTMGVAEGFANLIRQEENIRTIGCWNTAGSFSLPGGRIKLGKSLRLYYPIGGSMDEGHNIIIESQGDGSGGLKPDIHIPPDKELIIRILKGHDALIEESVKTLSLVPRPTSHTLNQFLRLIHKPAGG